MIKLEIPRWTSHHNMLIYSLLYYSFKKEVYLDINFNIQYSANGAILYVNNKNIFFDFSDSTILIDSPEFYDFYFKRSFWVSENVYKNIYPLNFQVNFSYKSLNLLRKFSFKDLINKNNRIEIVRALDICSLLTNMSHSAMDIRSLPKKTNDNGGI